MLRDVPLGSIWLTRFGTFQNSKLQNIKLEYILSHVVEMSQKKGEWVTEFTQDEYLEGFDPDPINITSNSELSAYFHMLIRMGFFKFDQKTQKISITKKFAELCKEHAVA